MLSANTIATRLRESYEDQQSLERKRRSEEQLDIYTGVIEPYVREQLKKFYVNNDDFITLSFANICKKVVNQSAKLYSKEPVRKFLNCTETQVEYLSKIYQQMGIDSIMLKLNQIYKLSSQAHLQVTPTIGQMGLKTIGASVIYNNNLDIVSSPVDPEAAEAYGLSAKQVRYFRIDPEGEDELVDANGDDSVMTVWSHEYNFIMNLKGQILSNNIENPLGIIPILEVSGEKYGGYWKTAVESSADFTVQLNASMSDAGQAKRFQGMPVGWAKGDEEQLKTDFQFGPNKLFKLPRSHGGQDMEIGFTNPNVNLDALLNFDSALLSLFLTCSDVDPNLINAKGNKLSFTSGYERFLAMIDAFKPSEDDISLFRKAENRLVKIISKYINLYGGAEGFELENVGAIPDEVEVSIEYQKPEQIMTRPEMLDTLRLELELGLITQLEAVAKYRGISLDEARKFLDEQNQGA